MAYILPRSSRDARGVRLKGESRTPAGRATRRACCHARGIAQDRAVSRGSTMSSMQGAVALLKGERSGASIY